MPTYQMSSEQLLTQQTSKYLSREKGRRGINIYTQSETWPVVGYGKRGDLIQGEMERPLFGLTLEERINLFRMCSPVYGIVTARQNRISALEWSIVRQTKNEDKIEENMKMARGLFNEYANTLDLTHLTVRMRATSVIQQYLNDVLPDLSNFDTAILRWRKRIRQATDDESDKIRDWLCVPNAHDSYEDFIKKTVQDLMVHGSFAWYKQANSENRLDNVYVLPGGTVIPFRSRYVDAVVAYIQQIPAVESKVYFADEMSYGSYCPSSAMAYGMIPLEALVNKLAESLFFDQLAAMRADGTVPPEKIAIFGETSPFGDLTNMPDDFKLPLDSAEQARLETILNEPRQNAIRVLTGTGTPAIMDLSRADTFQFQSERQRLIREEVALVMNMSNNEINLTGSEDTSGRSTSESQERIEREKGIYPIVKLLENKINHDLIAFRFDTDLYHLKYKTGLSDEEELKLDTEKVRSGIYAVNEVRMERDMEPFPDPKYDLPTGAAQGGPPDGSEANPLNMKQLGEGM